MQMCQSCQGEGMENIWPAALRYVQLDGNEVLARNTDKNGHKSVLFSKRQKKVPKTEHRKKKPTKSSFTLRLRDVYQN